MKKIISYFKIIFFAVWIGIGCWKVFLPESFEIEWGNLKHWFWNSSLQKADSALLQVAMTENLSSSRDYNLNKKVDFCSLSGVLNPHEPLEKTWVIGLAAKVVNDQFEHIKYIFLFGAPKNFSPLVRQGFPVPQLGVGFSEGQRILPPAISLAPLNQLLTSLTQESFYLLLNDFSQHSNEVQGVINGQGVVAISLKGISKEIPKFQSCLKELRN